MGGLCCLRAFRTPKWRERCSLFCAQGCAGKEGMWRETERAMANERERGEPPF